MIVQADLFDQRAMLAERLLGEHLFAELRGDADLALVAGCEANFIDAELRRSRGLGATHAPVSL